MVDAAGAGDPGDRPPGAREPVVASDFSLFATARRKALLPNFWEFIVLAVGCGLIAYGAIERSPGPAWLGVANLVVFVLSASRSATRR